MSIDHLLSPATLRRISGQDSDGQGGWIATRSPATIRCRIAPAGSRDASFAGRREAEVSHVCYFASELSLQVDDHIVQNGITYEVVVPDVSPSVRDHHHKALLKQQQTAA